jgi:hypothetical protein
MSIAIVTLVNVSSPPETLFIKELTLNILPNEELFLTEQLIYTQVNSIASPSLFELVQNDKVLVKINGVLQSKVDTLDYLEIPTPSGGGEANTASNVGSGAGVFKQKTGVDLELRSISSSDLNVAQGVDEIEIQAQPQLITNYASVTPASGMFVLVEDSGTLRSVDISNFLGSVTQVADEAARDLAYPSPADGFQVFNLRQGVVETYSTTFDLWLSSCMNVCVEDIGVRTVAIRKIVYLSTTAAVVGGQEYPILNYVAGSSDRNVTNGVVTRRGAAISGTQTYIAVHNFGKYYVDYGAAITIGTNIYSNTSANGLVIGANFAQSGTIGQAIESSGSNPSFPSSVLVSLQQRR